jgi:hypothetical protein
MPAPKPTLSGQKQLGRLLVSRANQGVQLFNAQITRTGHVHRQRRTGRPRRIPTVKIPVSATTFNEWFQGRHSDEKTALLYSKEKALAEKRKRKPLRLDREAHARFAFNIGINSILEVGRGSDGKPTHIIITKRPKFVPEAPEFWDLPAGLVRANQNPMDVINARSAAEVGIDKNKLQLIGKGLKPTKKEVWFALHRIDAATNYNAFVVQRAEISAEEAARTIQTRIESGRAKKDPWAPIDFVLIPRTPEAIREFIRTHDKTWIPEALRLYSFELTKAQKK